jgi:hypothetical protein
MSAERWLKRVVSLALRPLEIAGRILEREKEFPLSYHAWWCWSGQQAVTQGRQSVLLQQPLQQVAELESIVFPFMEPDHIHPVGRDDNGQSDGLQASCHSELRVVQPLQWHMLNTSDNNDRLLVTEEMPKADSRELPERENPAFNSPR